MKTWNCTNNESLITIAAEDRSDAQNQLSDKLFLLIGMGVYLPDWNEWIIEEKLTRREN
jgi:hypothetical protein